MALWIFLALVVVFVLLPVVGAAVWWVIWTAVVGALLGALARAVLPGRQNIGIVATVVCGWVGALGGGLIGSILWGFPHNHHHFATLLVEIGVAIVAVLGWSTTRRKAVTASTPQRVIDV
jgi:uncharacterized membrane protein YeaQ/YmgE (transglycosylase-associated protein family)